MDWLLIWAAFGALAHVYFAFQETVGWGPEFVKKAAKAWINPHEDPATTNAHIAWAKPLAANMGAYNLLLAFGLAWTARQAWVDAPTASPFGVLYRRPDELTFRGAGGMLPWRARTTAG